MNKKYLERTKMLNYESQEIMELISANDWIQSDDYHKIKSVYEYVQNNILFGYNFSDNINAVQVLEDGIGQCNTKATLLMALLRAVGIPCRLHAFDVSKDFQLGATTWIISKLAPKYIIHTWVEAYYKGTWYALEGVITDKKYLHAVQNKIPDQKGLFKGYAIATKDLQNPSIDWDCNDTFIQKEAIVHDYGVFSSPDEFFNTHKQPMSILKNFLYSYFGRKIMTRNVNKIRESVFYK